ncbi:alpha/beta fold hydrolase [Loktanella sp. S4079]|uniref:alpha/beta fold hydrolase n=1 Tax=Loktanella sp. S4079 TaxID=579483 RepID=UPI0005F9F99E|nr:alpha/beta hydrolase [Loktanella sp. S4079]KJZ20574.1 alpha/beta hydrolase [Loktanella sp. S4079]
MPCETLVMIPPMLCDAQIFEPQFRELGQDHAIMFAPTSKGERMEEIASQILSWAPSKFAVAGMGMGGMVAMEIMRRAPERVTRIALISTSPQPDTPEMASAREPQIIAARAGRWADVLQHEIHSTWMSPQIDKVALVRMLTRMGNALGPEAYVRQARAMQRRKDQQPVLRKITQPALVVCGRHDGMYPVKRHEFMAELIPYATLSVVEEAGYLPTVEAPEAVNAAMREWMKAPLMLRR